MKRPTLMAHAVLIAMLSTCGRAGELTPFVEDGLLGARIRGLDLPRNLPKELTSGLTSRVMVRVVLLADARTAGQRTAQMTVKYDLWDETFRFTLAIDERIVADETLASLDAVIARFGDTSLPALFSTQGLAPDGVHTLRADVLLNPIERERMEAIRKWVAENSTYTPPSPGAAEGTLSPGTATSNALFNRIFEQYTAGSEDAAMWRETVVSKPFRLEAGPRDGP